MSVKKKDKGFTELKDHIASAHSMIEEGTKRLQAGLKRKCMTDIQAAEALIDAGNKKLKMANSEISKNTCNWVFFFL